jgi:hypothetical protein
MCRQRLPGRVTLSILSSIRSIYSRCFSKPAFTDPIYQTIRQSHVQKIVEIGIGTGQRAIQMIETAQKASPQAEICYVGIDRFEDRSESDGPWLSLKEAHQLLRGHGARVQLVPGPSDALMRVANSLGKVDLLVVPEELDSPLLARVWFFVPRMLHEQSAVFVERRLEDGQMRLDIKPRDEIDQLAAAGVCRRAA